MGLHLRPNLSCIVAFTSLLTLMMHVLYMYNNIHTSEPSKKTWYKRPLQYFLLEDNETQQQYMDPGSRTAKPANKSQKAKVKRQLTIGIPTVKRPNKEYFMATLSSMLNKLSEEQLKKIVFVIYLADLKDTEWVVSTEKKIRINFPEHLEAGTLDILRAPSSFYKTLPTFGNNTYMNWRTKQNYDYAYMMQYSADIAELYLQMEDDVIVADGYYDAIMEYVREQDKTGWICLEFSELGFIGKLYRASDLRNLASMLLIFNTTQPVDETYLYYNKLKGFGNRIIRKPTLFQHKGVHSSLEGKIELLRDKYFDLTDKHWTGDNPPAKIFTTWKETNGNKKDAPYLHSAGRFWSHASARENDIYLLVFDTPQLLGEVIIETGDRDIPNDIIKDGVVEASSTILDSKEEPSCKDFTVLGLFVNGRAGINEIMLNSKLQQKKTKCLQIRVTKSQVEWVILKEIAVFVLK